MSADQSVPSSLSLGEATAAAALAALVRCGIKKLLNYYMLLSTHSNSKSSSSVRPLETVSQSDTDTDKNVHDIFGQK